MPGPRCNVTFCSNVNGMLTDDGERITFHRFPKKPELRNLWVENCQRTGNWNANYAYVCSEHFQKDDFIRDMQAELLGYKGRRKLKPFAVPCLNLPSGDKIIDKISSGTEYLKYKEQSERYDRLMEECMLTKKEEIPLSYETFKQYYDNKRKDSERKDSKVCTSSEFDSAEISNSNNVKNMKSPSKSKMLEKQRDVSNRLKRNVIMQKKMMEKIFLATHFDELFSETNLSYDDDDPVVKAKSALLKVCALAPKSYNRFARKLNLPSKDMLLTWSNKKSVLNNQ